MNDHFQHHEFAGDFPIYDLTGLPFIKDYGPLNRDYTAYLKSIDAPLAPTEFDFLLGIQLYNRTGAFIRRVCMLADLSRRQGGRAMTHFAEIGVITGELGESGPTGRTFLTAEGEAFLAAWIPQIQGYIDLRFGFMNDDDYSELLASLDIIGDNPSPPYRMDPIYQFELEDGTLKSLSPPRKMDINPTPEHMAAYGKRLIGTTFHGDKIIAIHSVTLVQMIDVDRGYRR